MGFNDILVKYGTTVMDEESEEYFSAIVDIAVNEYQIPVKKICREFGVSKPTVERWIQGRNAPHPIMRKVALERIIEMIEG